MLDSRPLEIPEEIQRSQSERWNLSLRGLVLLIAVSMAGMAAVDWVLSRPGISGTLIALATSGVALLLYTSLRSDRRAWHGPLLVAGILAVTAWSVYSRGSVRSASAFGLLTAVVVAGTYLSLRALLVTTAAAMLVLGGLTWAESGGYLVTAVTAVNIRYWLMGSVIILLIGVQLHQTRKTADEAYVRQLNQMEDRVRLESERDQSLRRFRRIFVLNPTALMIQSATTQAVLEVNPAFERCFGWSAEQIVGRPSRVLWADEHAWHEHRDLLFKQGRTDWQRGQWNGFDGRTTDVLVSSKLCEDNADMLIMTTAIEEQRGGWAALQPSNDPPAG